jgi:hypothetical protein
MQSVNYTLDSTFGLTLQFLRRHINPLAFSISSLCMYHFNTHIGHAATQAHFKLGGE